MSISDLSEDDVVLAGEYALGVLSPADMAAAAARLRRDTDFAVAVADWRERFVALDAETAEVSPPPRVWAAIERRLFAPAAARPTPAGGGLWGWLTGIGFAFAIVLGLWVVVDQRPQPQPTLTAEIAAEDASLRIVAVYDAATGSLEVTRLTGAAPSGRVLELWAIAGDNPPVSLGLVEDEVVTIAGFPEAFAAAGVTLAVSEEPPNGSPTGQPTGAVLAAGALTPV